MPAFRCSGLWPRSASHWPQSTCQWPPPQVVQEVKNDGFDLLSKECSTAQRGKQSAIEGDAWMLSFNDAENKLLQGSNRKKCLSILRTLRDRNLDVSGQSCITTYYLKTLVLYECEKHPHEYEWDEYNLGYRVNGILLQLISCLQSRRCPHYFLLVSRKTYREHLKANMAFGASIDNGSSLIGANLTNKREKRPYSGQKVNSKFRSTQGVVLGVGRSRG